MAQVFDSRIYGHVRTPMRFWPNEALLMRNRRFWGNKKPYALVNPSHYLPDFTIIRSVRYAPIITAQVEDLSGNVMGSPFPTLGNGFSFDIRTIEDKNYIVCYGRNPISSRYYSSVQDTDPLPCGIYQIRIGDGVEEWVSEPIELIDGRYADETDVLDGQGYPTVQGDWNIVTGTFNFGLGTISNITAGPSELEINVATVHSDSLYSYCFVKVYIEIVVTGTCNLSVKLDGVTIGLITATGNYTFYGRFGATGLVTFDDSASVAWLTNAVLITPLEDEIPDRLKLSWKSDCDIGNMFNRGNQGAIKNEFFLPVDAEIGRPEYKLSTDGGKNGQDDNVSFFRKRTRRYKLDFGDVPEHILDALYEVYMFDDVMLIEKNGIGQEAISDVKVDSDWLFNDQSVAAASMMFGYDDDSVKTSCCDELPETEIIPVQMIAILPDVPVTVDVQDMNGDPVSSTQNTNSFLFYQVGDVITFTAPATHLGHASGNDGGGVGIYVRVIHSDASPDTSLTSASNSIEITMETGCFYIVQFNYDLKDAVANMYPPIYGFVSPPAYAGDPAASITLVAFYGTTLADDYTFLWTHPDATTSTGNNIASAVEGTYACEITYTGGGAGNPPAGFAAAINVIPYTLTFIVPTSREQP